MTTTLNASNSGSGGLVATADASGILALQTAGTTAVTINASQNVGVGTTSPSVKLDVTGAIKASVSVTSAADFIGGGASGYAALYADGAGGLVICRGSSSTNQIELYSNSAERFRIGSAGQLGIGGATYGTSGQVLTSGGSGAAPSWTTLSASKLLRITRYTTAGSGTWTKPSDTNSVLINTIAGGGGGAGGSSGVWAGGGGSSGGYAQIFIASAAASYAYTVGAGGSAGAGNAAGSAGSATTIAGIAAGAGAGGETGGAGYGGSGGVGTTPTGGNVNIQGGSGQSGDSGNVSQSNGTGGNGGSGFYGGAGRGAGFNSPTGGAGVYGGGGGGGAGGNNAGGAGGAGYIEIWEFS